MNHKTNAAAGCAENKNAGQQRILYLECASGISGDMTVAALLDLGADEEKLRAALASLPLEGYRIQLSRVKKAGLDACDFAVLLDAAHENHDHDMAYLHGDMHVHNDGGHDHDGHMHSHDASDGGHGHSHTHDGSHGDDGHSHTHDGSHGDDGHSHARGGHHHEHRGLPEIREIIAAGELTPGARELSYRIFDILADAEAKAHGVAREQVHFHEVGAVDSIVDIVAAAVCLDDLAPGRIVVSPLSEGTGTVRCQHGVLPIPVPAVANIVSAHGLTIHGTGVMGELVTPTGAAIAAAVLQTHNSLPDDYVIRGVGIGAGKREYATAGILRAMWIEAAGQTPDSADAKKTGYAHGTGPADETGGAAAADRIVKLEANIDDATGEELGYCMDVLQAAGARDVSFMPLYMKKNRPAYELRVICAPEDVTRLEEIIFRQTTTIGIRRAVMERTVMERTCRTVETPYGAAQVKLCRHGDVKKIYPEYESVAALCRAGGRDFGEVYQVIVNCARKCE